MKIIDADKLHYKQVYIHTEKGLRPALVVFAKEIRKMPEIVRCKDCKHRYYDRKYGYMCIMDSADPHEQSRGVDDGEWYCADGERRENETD